MYHRVSQAFEASQLLRMCQLPNHVMIFAGDLNCVPGDVAYRLIKHNARLTDSFIQAPTKARFINKIIFLEI